MIDASDGHARNFLIPRKLAKPATDGSIKEHKNMKAKERRKKSS